MIRRIVHQQIEKQLFKGRVISVLGPRQCGKTTMLQQIIDSRKEPCLWLNADEPDVSEKLTGRTSTYLKSVIGKNKILVIDEAQRIKNIGLIVKLIHDNIKGVQVIVSGSSSLELQSEINEPLTGRKIEFQLLPFSFQELSLHHGLMEEKRLLEHRLLYGTYPDIALSDGNEKLLLKQLADSYLFKDLLVYDKIKKSSLLLSLLQALALQIGNEVSYNELAGLLGVDKETVEKYIDLFEKAFIVFKLPSLNRNHRNEIKMGKKVYFYDIGVRNAIINNFTPVNLRTDKGNIFENFMIAERYKFTLFNQLYCNRFFWRTTTQQEIDYIEEYSGKLHTFEFKWSDKKKVRMPLGFVNSYKKYDYTVIHHKNFEDVLLPK